MKKIKNSKRHKEQFDQDQEFVDDCESLLYQHKKKLEQFGEQLSQLEIEESDLMELTGVVESFPANRRVALDEIIEQSFEKNHYLEYEEEKKSKKHVRRRKHGYGA